MQTDKLSQDAASAQMGQIMDEYLERANRGERPSIEEYAGRYPGLADVIRKMLPTLEVMQASGGLEATGDVHTADEIRPDGPLGDFQIVRELGRGGMGVVYEARQISLGRTVALKVLPFAAAMDDRQLQRFKNEAQAAACLHHAHIVPVFGVGCERGVHYYAMQLIEGQSLAKVIDDVDKQGEGGLVSGKADRDAPEDRQAEISTQVIAALSTAHSSNTREYFRSVAKLAHQAAAALEHAHQAGVIHRDIKPANLILDQRGEVWITDFGLAQVQSDVRLTMTGDLMGTLRYMSPEQALAKRVTVDHRTDIYSLGATLYELLTLQPAYSGGDREELLRQIAFEESKPARRINHAIPVELETIVMKAMAKNPAERYASADEFADDLQRFLEDRPITAKRPTLAQHVTRWTRRHRGVAVTIAAAMVFAIIGLGISTAVVAAQKKETKRALDETTNVVGQLREKQKEKDLLIEEKNWLLAAETEAKRAETKAKEALAELVRLREEARQREQVAIRRERRHSYDHEIMLANDGVRNGNPNRAMSVLKNTRREFREWEWSYLTRKVHDVRFSFSGAITTSNLSKRARRVHFSPQADFLAIPVYPDGPEGSRRQIGLAFVSAQTGKTIYVAAPKDARRIVTGRNKVRGDLACAFAPNSARAAYAILGKRISVVDLSAKRELFSLDNHEDDVTCLSFSQDGKWLASGSEDKTVRIWDLQSRECVRVYEAHAHALQEVAFCPDGSNRLVSQSGLRPENTSPNRAYLGVSIVLDPGKRGFRVADVIDGAPADEAGFQVDDIITKVDQDAAAEIDHFVQHLSGYSPGDVVRFEVQRGEQKVTLETTLKKAPGWLAVHGPGLARDRARRSYEIHVWDSVTGALLTSEVKGQFRSWSPNGQHFAYTKWRWGGGDTVIATATGDVAITGNDLEWAQFRPDSQRVLFGGKRQSEEFAGVLEEWDLDSRERVKELPSSEIPSYAAYVLDGTHILVAHLGTMRVDVMEAESGKIVGGRRVSSAYSRDAFLVDKTGRYFTMQISNGYVEMWDVRSWMAKNDWQELPGDYLAANVAGSPDGKLIAIVNKTTNSVDILDANTASLVHRLPAEFTLTDGDGSKYLLFDESGTHVAIMGQEDPVRFNAQAWNLSDQTTTARQRGAEGSVKSVAFFGQELRALVADQGRWQVVDVAKDEFIWELTPSRGPRGWRLIPKAGQLLKSGEKVVMGYVTRDFDIWDIDQDKLDSTLRETGLTRVRAQGWASPAGNYLLAYESGETWAIYDTRTGERNVAGQFGAVRITQFHWSPNEQRLLAVGMNESYLIDVTTGRELLTLEHRRPLLQVSFSSPQRIVAVTDKGRVKVLNGTALTSDTPPHSRLLRDLAWNTVLDPHSSREDVLRAVELAQDACDRSVGVSRYQHVLGAAHYRIGNYHAAVETLASTDPTRAQWRYVRGNESTLRSLQSSDPYRWFLAMAQWQLGDKEAATETFNATYVSAVEDQRLRELAGETAQLLGASLVQKLQEEQNHREFVSLRGSTPDERASLLIQMRDQDGNGTISENEMSDNMRSRFTEYDTDGNGAIDRSELIERFGVGSRSRATGFLSQFDEDDDGKLSQDETPTFWQLQFSDIDEDEDGSLQVEEIEQFFEQGGVGFGVFGGGTRRPALSFLSRYDQDDDGVLSQDEAPRLFQQQFSDIDENEDGSLQVEEIEQFFEQRTGRGFGFLGLPGRGNRSPEGQAASMMSQFDQDGDAILTKDELPGVIWNRYKSFDADDNGKLNQDELMKAVTSRGRPSISRTGSLLQALDRFFSRQDKDGDKVVTEEESNETPWRLYLPHDTNGDGRLEIEEVRKSLEAEIAKQNE